MTPQQQVPPSRRPWWSAAIALSVILLSALHQAAPTQAIQVHNFLQHLFFLPLVVTGLIYGWRGAFWVSLAVGLIQVPHVYAMWNIEPVYALDQVLEWPVFCIAGVVAGLLSQKEHRQRLRAEMTKQQLEAVYTELRGSVEQLKKAERLSAAGQLAAGLAHEIRNPLASISGAAGILKRGNASPDDSRECLEIIEKESQRLNRLLGSFLEFAKPRPPRKQRIDVQALLDSVAALAQRGAEPGAVCIITSPVNPPVELDADPEQLKQVLLNLLLNAIQASPAGAAIHLDVVITAGRVYLSVTDEGPGIPADAMPHVFEPFFTTKESGTGLGLAIARNLVEQNHGQLTAERKADRGMRFTLDFPVAGDLKA